MTKYEFIDGTLDPWMSRTGTNIVDEVAQFGHKGLIFDSTADINQEVVVPNIGTKTKHDLRFYYDFTGAGLNLRFKPFSVGNNFTDDGYYVEILHDPLHYTGLTFYIKKIVSGVTTTLTTVQKPGYEFKQLPNVLSLDLNANGILKVYYNNNLITTVEDHETFDSQYMVIQKFTPGIAQSLSVDYVETDSPLSNLEPYRYLDWHTDDLNGWIELLGATGLGPKSLDYTIGDGIQLLALWDWYALEYYHTAINGQWIFNFINKTYGYYLGGDQHSTSFYPILDYYGNGYIVRYHSMTGAEQSANPNHLELYKVNNWVETLLSVKPITSDHNPHILQFRIGTDNKIKVILDGIVKFKNIPIATEINNSTRMRVQDDAGYYRNLDWYGFVEYTPITHAKYNNKSIADIPYYVDLPSRACIRPLSYEILSKATILKGKQTLDIKSKAYISFNGPLSTVHMMNFYSKGAINTGAFAIDFITKARIGAFQRRLTIHTKILYAPRRSVVGDPTKYPPPENYPEDYGKESTVVENGGISIQIGGKTYI